MSPDNKHILQEVLSKKSEGCGAAFAGGVDPEGLWIQRASRLWPGVHLPGEHALLAPAGLPDSLANAAEGVGGSAGAVRLSTPDGVAKAGGMACERETRLSDLQGGGSDDSDEAAEEDRTAKAPHRGAGEGAESALEHGLRGGSSRGWKALPNSDGGGLVHEGMRGHQGQAEAKRQRCGRGPGYGGPGARQANVNHGRQRQRVRSKGNGRWADSRAVHLAFIRPGKPTENAFIESFNGELRDERLNTEIFRSMAEVRGKLAAWRYDHNHRRTHSALGDQTPTQFAARNPAPSPACFNGFA